MERRVYRYETVGSTNTELMALAGRERRRVPWCWPGSRRRAGPHGPQLPVPGGAGAVRIGAAAEQPGGRSSHSGAGGHGGAPCHPPQLRSVLRHQMAQRSGAVGRKVCGILAEALPGPEGSLWVVVGIGINVCQRREDFLPELRETAASLSMIGRGGDRPGGAGGGLSGGTGGPAPELPQETAGAAAGVRSRLPESGPPGSGAAPRRRAEALGGVPDTGLRPCGAL